MKRSSYREQDRAFGQLMLMLRTASGLTQAGLADLLGVSRHAIGGWEAGQSYPKADHLKHFIVLCLQQRAFAAGREADEIRALWRAAHQKVLLDELWLQALIIQHAPRPAPIAQSPAADRSSAHVTGRELRRDWSDALDVPSFYGRASELELLVRWVVDERCRVVSVLGMGGIGKSALTVAVMRQVAAKFDVVIWHSLRDAPTCEALLETCLQVLALQAPQTMGNVLEGQLHILMAQLRDRRVLLVLDNLEVLLEDTGTGRMRAGFESYARLLRRIGETAHQSCLLLTSREKPADLVPLEGTSSPVRAVRLAGIDARAGAWLLAERDVVGTAVERERLAEVYGGNPLALKIVAQTIVDLFGGESAPFLAQGEVVFGGVRQLLDEQFERLSILEQTVFFWLAILREPISLAELLAAFSKPEVPAHVLEALEGLYRRSLIERGQRMGSFTLQSVVLEYATARLIAEMSSEIAQGQLTYLISYALCQGQAKDYLRKIQEQLLVLPTLTQLRSIYQRQADIEARLLGLIDQLRGWPQQAQGYGPANLVVLLRVLRGNLRGLDLSRLALRGVSLQGVEMQDARLTGAVLQESAFTEAFDAITAIAISSNGQYWAAASRGGDIRLWNAGGKTLYRTWRAHTDMLYALTFSPNNSKIASASWDGTVKLWDATTGSLLWSGRHIGHVNSVAFSPDGRLLASGGDDGTARLWDAQSGTQLHALPHSDLVISIAWSPDERLLATGDIVGGIRLWQVHPNQLPTCVETLIGHTTWVDGLAFSPDGSTLASASNDGTVKLWDMADGSLWQTLTGHTNRVTRVAWSPDGRTLASSSFDQMIWLWDVEQRSYRIALREHTAVVVGVAFTPDSRSLLSGSEDGTLRVWDAANGLCVHVQQGYATSLYDVAWSPDGTRLISAGSDTLVTIFDVTGRTPPRMLGGHSGVVFGVGWSSDGRWLSSSEWDNAIRLWNPTSGACVEVLAFRDDPGNIFSGLAWSPDGQRLAAGTYRRGVQVFKMMTHHQDTVERAFPTWIRSVAWSPDGALLAGGGDDGTVYIWDAEGRTLLQKLVGHHSKVTAVAWNRTGTRLVSVSSGNTGGELLVWDPSRAECLSTIVGQAGIYHSVTWGPNEDLVISGGGNGNLRWWDVRSGLCIRIQKAHQGTVQALRRSPDGTRLASCGDDGAIMLWDLDSGEHLRILRRDRPYERLDITGIKGLSDAQQASLRALGALEETSLAIAKG